MRTQVDHNVEGGSSKLRRIRDGERLASRLGTLAEHLSGLRTTNTSTPLTPLLLVLVRAGRS